MSETREVQLARITEVVREVFPHLTVWAGTEDSALDGALWVVRVHVGERAYCIFGELQEERVKQATTGVRRLAEQLKVRLLEQVTMANAAKRESRNGEP